MSIGSVISRRDPQGDPLDTIKLTGVIGDQWVCEPALEFGSSFAASARDLSAEYGTDVPEPPRENREDEYQAALNQRALDDALRGYAGRTR